LHQKSNLSGTSGCGAYPNIVDAIKMALGQNFYLQSSF